MKCILQLELTSIGLQSIQLYMYIYPIRMMRTTCVNDPTWMFKTFSENCLQYTENELQEKFQGMVMVIYMLIIITCLANFFT